MLYLRINGQPAAKSFLSPEIKVPVYISETAYYTTSVTDPLLGMDPVAVVFLDNMHNTVAIKQLSSDLCQYLNGMWRIKGSVFKAVVSSAIKIIFSDQYGSNDLTFTYEIENQEPVNFVFSLEIIGDGHFTDNTTKKEFNLLSGNSVQYNISLNKENAYCLIKPSILNLGNLLWQQIL